jgi:RNA polymerase sigma factor (sigma-70 family)
MVNGQWTSARGLSDGPPLPGPDEGTDAELLGRFAHCRDEAAFAALVRRHGPMVWGVCRRVLNDWHRAEDAFQVTFLVLARKAGSLSRPGLLGNWLYGVAYRTAVKARGRAARQGEQERQAVTMASTGPADAAARRELREVLDDELSRLPEKYRAPLVLCYLEGRTNEEAARLLGWPVGSMSWRLTRARRFLRARLAGYGFAFDLRFCSRLLAQHEFPAEALPDELAEATARAAAGFVAGPGEAAVSPENAALTREVLRALEERPPRWRRALAWAAGLLGLRREGARP